MTTSKRTEMLKAPAFSQTKAFAEPTSEKPIDLTKEGALSAARIQAMKSVGAGFTCLYGFERVREGTLTSLSADADDAVG